MKYVTLLSNSKRDIEQAINRILGQFRPPVIPSLRLDDFKTGCRRSLQKSHSAMDLLHTLSSLGGSVLDLRPGVQRCAG